jgi:hypothetical protein
LEAEKAKLSTMDDRLRRIEAIRNVELATSFVGKFNTLKRGIWQDYLKLDILQYHPEDFVPDVEDDEDPTFPDANELQGNSLQL